MTIHLKTVAFFFFLLLAHHLVFQTVPLGGANVGIWEIADLIAKTKSPKKLFTKLSTLLNLPSLSIVVENQLRFIFQSIIIVFWGDIDFSYRFS